MTQAISGKKVAILVGGSDLFSGLKGISPGTRLIRRAIKPWYNDVLAVNFNYFLDFGRTLKQVKKYVQTVGKIKQLVLYGYSKGGDVVLQLARSVEKEMIVDLLVTVDVANGPWSDKINRTIPENVERNINIFQSRPNILRSCGAPTHGSGHTTIKNIDLTDKILKEENVSHSNIEMLMVPQVIQWLTTAQPGTN